MRCGRDLSLIKVIERENGILEDLLSLVRSRSALAHISVDIQRNMVRPMLLETSKLQDKFMLYQSISIVVLKSIGHKIRNTEDDQLDDSNSVKNFKVFEELDEKFDAVSKIRNELDNRREKLDKTVVDTAAKWEVELFPNRDELGRMTMKERKELVKLWKERERMGHQARSTFEDLHAEWNAMKGELDKDIMNCLRGVASLKDSP